MDLKEARKKYQGKYFENHIRCFHVIKVLKIDNAYVQNLVTSVSDIIDKVSGELVREQPWVFNEDFIRDFGYERSNKSTFNNNIRKIKRHEKF